MAGGLLSESGGKNLPGECHNYSEAKEKIKRILNGDKKFIDLVRSTQNIILNRFSNEYCYKHWQDNFLSLLKK